MVSTISVISGIATELLLSFWLIRIINKWAIKKGIKLSVFQLHELYMKLGCWMYAILCIGIHFLRMTSHIWLWDYLLAIFLILQIKCLLSSYIYEELFQEEEQDFYGKYGRLIQYVLCVVLIGIYMLSNVLAVRIAFASAATLIFIRTIWLQFSETWADLFKRETYNFKDVTNMYFYALLPMVFFIINCF